MNNFIASYRKPALNLDEFETVRVERSRRPQTDSRSAGYCVREVR